MLRIGRRAARLQRAGVGMQRRPEHCIARPVLDRPAKIHHDHLVGDVPDHREVVRDEEIGEPELLLQLQKEVQDLRLDRDVERRDRLVEHDDFGSEHQRARDRDALALAA